MTPVSSVSTLQKPTEQTLVSHLERIEKYKKDHAEKNPIIDIQPSSYEIWEDKYCLKTETENLDKDIPGTMKRVAHALASLETANYHFWYKEFYAAMQLGATPGGRILSNAGAGQHKLNTSLINCTVSTTIHDDMDHILDAIKEGGKTLKAGCGIGYEFSTLRPKGSFVSGVGSTTSGPISFMDIFDAMCLTISSAGGRRGAQMATMDIHHPDVLEFITAKRQNGRLRHFNLSVLITQDFIEAVKSNADWKLSFPINKNRLDTINLDDENECVYREFPVKDTNKYLVTIEGKVACKVYRIIKARELWNTIMKSAYDYGEPGFILIDEVNKMNNNYWCENIRATNPCVTGDTPVITKDGEKPISELVGQEVEIWNGYEWSKVKPRVTGTNELITTVIVELSGGNYGSSLLRCTNHHKWILKNGSRVPTTELEEEQELMEWETPKGDKIKGKVKSINRDVYVTDKVYCFTDTLNHSGVFNQILTANCGEQPLPPYGSCLLGSINLTKFVLNPFSSEAYFDYDAFAATVRVFTRMLDNVADISGLPLPEQVIEIKHKRRHGMGYFGLGSSMSMLGIEYGKKESVKFTESVTKILALEGWRMGVELAKEKGVAPVLENPKNLKSFCDSEYMKKIRELDSNLYNEIEKHGVRFTHHTTIPPTGTTSSSVGNNASNGIEPSFSHEYIRNMIVSGKKTKEKLNVRSYEYLVYLTVNGIKPDTEIKDVQLPVYMVTADNIKPEGHLAVQAAAQKWVDSAVSKTINVPTNFPFAEFEDIYLKAVDMKLKGCTTFRFNPEAFQGVLVNKEDLHNTIYSFTLEDGSTVEYRGDQEVFYDGEIHTAANLFDAIKEKTYGRY